MVLYCCIVVLFDRVIRKYEHRPKNDSYSNVFTCIDANKYRLLLSHKSAMFVLNRKGHLKVACFNWCTTSMFLLNKCNYWGFLSHF